MKTGKLVPRRRSRAGDCKLIWMPTMALHTVCPKCGRALKADSKLGGRHVKCPRCAHHFQLTPRTKPLSDNDILDIVGDPPPSPDSSGTDRPESEEHWQSASSESRQKAPAPERDQIGFRRRGLASQTCGIHQCRWGNETYAISGLSRFGDVYFGLIATPTEFVVVRGAFGPRHKLFLLIPTAFFVITVCIMAPIPWIVDELVLKPKRDKVWHDFGRHNLDALRENRRDCQFYPMSALSMIAFNDADDMIYVNVGLSKRKVKCSPDDRQLFRAFAEHCRMRSSAEDRLFGPFM